MLTLTIRTDKPESELGLYQDSKQLAYKTWSAHRQLAETIHHQLQTLLQNNKVELGNLTGLVIYQGPGSFTGLRIGTSVANALADSLKLPIIGANNANWQSHGIDQLVAGKNEYPVTPEYGGRAFTTKPVK